jgi:molecular chaperone HtpG
MEKVKGNLSINSENILPVIKKWLYSDTDIFLRELVSNACDAINKFKKLVSMGEADAPENESYKVTVRLDNDAKTIQIIDNGIGMTADEIQKYITEIAFSGASDFVAKYQEQFKDGNDIIGHFGLGFYSAFMVAERVEIDSLSYAKDAKAANWVCDGGIEYELGDSDRAERGTTVTLHIGEEGKDFLNGWKLKEILAKYCYFMPIEIYFEDAQEIAKKAEEAAKKIEEAKDKDTAPVDVVEEPKPINDTEPLWLKKPSDVTDEEYKSFYHKVFTDFNEPLFWIHLNMDYPFRLKGILYFPKLKHELDSIEGQVKLYNNQVFIADNLKEVIPEFLLLLKGTIDCPDLPLNVSRSFLQNDGYVTKMSKYITKKVADKLNSLFKKNREEYEGFWKDISQFIKYGCMREHDFYDKVKESLLFQTTDGKFVTMKEYLDGGMSKDDKKLYYVTDEQQQAQYIKLFKDNGMEAVVLDTKLDVPYVSFLEANSEGVKLARIDSDVAELLKSETEVELDSEALEKLFKSALNNENIKLKVQTLKTAEVSAMIELNEQTRRMQEMSKMYGFGGDMPMDEELVLNSNNKTVQLLLELSGKEDKKEEADMLCKQIYDLAVMSHKPLSQEAMTAFVARSNKIMELLAEK